MSAYIFLCAVFLVCMMQLSLGPLQTPGLGNSPTGHLDDGVSGKVTLMQTADTTSDIQLVDPLQADQSTELLTPASMRQLPELMVVRPVELVAKTFPVRLIERPQRPPRA